MKKSLIIGEHCLDEYIIGSVNRLNPEAPCPILSEPLTKRICAGMASNVAANIAALEGFDPIIISNVTPIIKRRYCDKNSSYILLRVDEHDFSDIEFDEVHLKKIEKLLDEDALSYIIISDYNKGFISEYYINRILRMAEHVQVPTFLDTKKILGQWSREAFCIKLNQKEYNNNIKQISNETVFDNYLIVTNGDKPIQVNCSTDIGCHVPVTKQQVINVCGAGDTMIAGLAYNFNRTSDVFKAVDFGAKCASKACGYFGTHILNKSDIQEINELVKLESSNPV